MITPQKLTGYKPIGARLPPDWESKLYEHYSAGGTDVEARAMMRRLGYPVNIHQWYRMIREEPAFNEVLVECRSLSEAYWVRKIREVSVYTQGNGNEKPDAGLIKFYMANIFQWSDTIKVQAVPLPENRDALIAEARRLGIPTENLFDGGE